MNNWERLDSDEMMKLFDFILENKNIIISDNGLFSRDTLIMMRAIVRGTIPNDFQLTLEQEQMLIDAFLKSKNSFNQYTPMFIIKNESCDIASIDRNLNSINFIKSYSPELEAYTLNKVINEDYILCVDSPDFLKSNYKAALNSILLNKSSADYINWYAMTDDECDVLVDELIKNDYILSNESCYFLRSNTKIVLNSIKKNINNIRYAIESLSYEPEIFKHLLLNGYYFSIRTLGGKALSSIKEYDVFKRCLELFHVYGRNENQKNKKYVDRFNDLFYNAINSRPTIKTFESVFQSIAETNWNKQRNQYKHKYENILGKICAELRNVNNFDVALKKLSFLNVMKKTLGNKYNEMYEAMEEYFNLYHGNTVNKLEKMQLSQDVIAKLSALYVSKQKEKFKKEELKECYDRIRRYFVLKVDNPMVRKKYLDNNRKLEFKYLYMEKDKDVCNFINNLAQEYSKNEDINLVFEFIKQFVINDFSKIEDIISVPTFYNEYERYEKALKLIKRLNRGHIKYNGAEVYNYRDIIQYDNMKKQYVYIGMNFNGKMIEEYDEFRRKAKLFEKIKKDITLKIKSIKVNEEIDYWTLDSYEYDFPFTDEFFEFNEQSFKSFCLYDLVNKCMPGKFGFNPESFIDDNSFSSLNNLLINNGIIWILLFESKNHFFKIMDDYDDSRVFINIINNMKTIVDYAKRFSFNTSKFDELLLLNEMSEYADDKSIAILGKDIIEKLSLSLTYTNRNMRIIIEIAKELVAQMVKRSKSTVPYVRGETINYKYSIYDSQDNTLLLAGINTDACFRVDGNDNDFLHYCALDKNGFVIKITDSYNNFIARASGFRNGNCIFLNQLRTIYDEGGDIYHGRFVNEKKDIISTLKKACSDIVNVSQSNDNETDKIDFVFITQSYSLTKEISNVSDDVADEIGSNPMDNKSSDWNEFVNNTNNLKEVNSLGYFSTDYGNYPLICLAASKDVNAIECDDIKFKDVPAVYERTRNTIIVTDHPDIDIINSINKVNGINSYFKETSFVPVSIPENSVVIIGDNWYAIYSNGCIINSCVLSFDEKAIIEFEATKKALEELTLINTQKVDIEQFAEHLKLCNSQGKIKTLKI